MWPPSWQERSNPNPQKLHLKLSGARVMDTIRERFYGDGVSLACAGGCVTVSGSAGMVVLS